VEKLLDRDGRKLVLASLVETGSPTREGRNPLPLGMGRMSKWVYPQRKVLQRMDEKDLFGKESKGVRFGGSLAAGIAVGVGGGGAVGAAVGNVFIGGLIGLVLGALLGIAMGNVKRPEF